MNKKGKIAKGAGKKKNCPHDYRKRKRKNK
jgi:hypothetical protein